MRLAAAHAALGLVMGLCFWWAASGNKSTARADTVNGQPAGGPAVASAESAAERSLTPDKLLGRRLGLGEAPPGQVPSRSLSSTRPPQAWDQVAEGTQDEPLVFPAAARPSFFGPHREAPDSESNLSPVPALSIEPMASVQPRLLSDESAATGSTGLATKAKDLRDLSPPGSRDWPQ